MNATSYPVNFDLQRPVLFLLRLIGSIVALIAVVSILAAKHYPQRLWTLQRNIVCREARLLAYLACIVENYPPYTLGA